MKPLAFVTGASSGIGQALALDLHRRGWLLALASRRVHEIEQWLAHQSLGSDVAMAYGADVTVIDSIVAAGQACLEQQGLPDLVIANAGISIGIDSAVRSDLDILAQTFATNNIGMAATFQPFIEPMRARKSGTLVGIGSVAGIRGLPGHGAYCSSKAAVISYLESLRGELRADGLNVLTICPGYVATPLTSRNRYAMPFLLSPEAFAARAVDAIERRSSYVVIPWQMGIVAKALRMLPNGLFDRVLAGRPRKRRTGE